ncbi:hypothetical protein K2173_008079 [Erythroxylum novogranatense]|uniref:WRKY transcription factor n=1 Tax=Erythroxylum novogranatense TaxID=1862640 RepID=A0AAV8S9A2_9ROSI|nr:hypothetical protein K2173_008079 [Erythroxylum novogranatense]
MGTREVKIENVVGSSTFPDHVQSIYPLQGVLELCEGDKSSLGFMELLGMQEFGSSLFDILPVPSRAQESNPLDKKMESSELLNNQPATPISSSISSASSEALNEEQVKARDNEEIEQQKTKKELKPKKTNQKRPKEPKFAFMTKSEVDHLEDGYRWRKYGQKAVKNSPFPRSYYRCTASSCNVKKRIERSFTDPSVVVTTYEGQHIHPSPVMPRPSFIGAPPESGFSTTPFATPVQRSNFSLYQQHQQSYGNSLPHLGFGYNGTSSIVSSLGERRFCNALRSALAKDNGLLQDIVPSRMIKEE